MRYKNLFNLLYTITKEMFFMVFTTKSRVAQSYAILILAEEMTMNDVPNVGNLRVVVLEILGVQPQA